MTEWRVPFCVEFLEEPSVPRVVFTKHLERHLECPPRDVPGESVREVLRAVFSESPRLETYLLDDQGHLRQHVAIFVDGAMVRDRTDLGHRVQPDSEVYVMQALSGG